MYGWEVNRPRLKVDHANCEYLAESFSKARLGGSDGSVASPGDDVSPGGSRLRKSVNSPSSHSPSDKISASSSSYQYGAQLLKDYVHAFYDKQLSTNMVWLTLTLDDLIENSVFIRRQEEKNIAPEYFLKN